MIISEQQYSFMPGKSSIDVMFSLRILMEQYKEGQKELYCVFVDLGAKREGELLFEEVESGREVCNTGAGYV